MRDWIMDHAAKDVPLVMLVVMMFASFWMLWCAARKPESFIGKMMIDPDDKPSVLRLVILWGFMFASWVLMRDALRPEGVDVSVFAIYVAATFGGPIAGKFLEKWNGVMPFQKGPTQ